MISEPSYTTLHQAAKDGHLPLFETLVDFRCHVDTADADGCTALFYAVQYEHRDTVELLLKNGANVKNRHARTGITSVHYLAKTGNVTLLAFLVGRTWYTVDLGMGDRVVGWYPFI
jgi:ankyrin repeat protein